MLRRALPIAALIVAAFAGPAGAGARPRPLDGSEAATAMDFLGALGRRDMAAAAALLDEDAVLDLPYAGDGVTLRGRAGVMQFFEQTLGRSVSGIAYRLERAYPSPEAGAVVLEISTRAQTAAGKPYTNRLVGIFAFRDGRITLFREYFDAARIK